MPADEKLMFKAVRTIYRDYLRDYMVDWDKMKVRIPTRRDDPVERYNTLAAFHPDLNLNGENQPTPSLAGTLESILL